MVKKQKKQAKSSSPKRVAIVQSGSKQFVVKEGDSFLAEKLQSKTKRVKLEDLLSGKQVQLRVGKSVRGKKITMLKFKNKTRRLKFRGHRQNFVRLTVEKIF